MASVIHQSWRVERGLGFKFSFFLSHVSEDNARAVSLQDEIHRLSEEVGTPRKRCYLDVTNWTNGVDNGEVIRNALLQSEHMVLLVTPAYLRARRGWVWMELAYGEIIHEDFRINTGGRENIPSYPFIFPVFVDVKLRAIERTPLLMYWQRKLIVDSKSTDLITQVAKLLVAQYQQVHSE